jgi:serine/threonine-protein kinase
MGATDPLSRVASPGELLAGRYELECELGRGSSGTVWRALDREHLRPVAVKLLRADAFVSASARKRFEREVDSASALDHPHSVAILGHGLTPAGGAYLVMELLEGVTLASLLRSAGPLPQARAIRIVAQILDAVGAAHRLGIVHRDLKPANVLLVERDGRQDFVKVCDFGLAKSMEPEGAEATGSRAVLDLGSATTEEGMICGTPEYMSPEQARGETLDARTDLYAIGVVLFLAVVGELPFQGRSALAVVSQHLVSPPPRPSTQRPDLVIFQPLENLILRALAKDRAERPSSALTFRSDLLQIERDLLHRAGVSERPAAAIDETLREATPPSMGPRRKQQLTLWVALGAAAVGAAGVGRLLSTRRADERPRSPRSTSLQTVPSTLATAQATPDNVPTASNSPVPDASAALATASGAAQEPATATDLSAHPSASGVRPRFAPASDLELERARALLANGDAEAACVLARTVTERRANSAAAWKLLGQCSMRLGAREQGVAAYQRYLELVPTSPDALFIRSIIGEASP